MAPPTHDQGAAMSTPTVVVLGAGGAAGWAFHAGVVDGLAELGAPLDGASHVIATSAGAPVAAAVLAGRATSEVVAALLRPPTVEEMAGYRSTMEEVRSTWWRRLRPAAPRLAAVVRPGGPGVGVALAGLLPAGAFPTGPLRRAPGVEELGRAWPSGLWIPAVRLRDGHRVVFGRDRTDVDVADAVEATQAVPVMFTPLDLDGVRFVDGATWSPTNADLALDLPDPGRMVVVAPMLRHPSAIMARFARRRLRRELERVRAAGWDVAVVVPDDEAADHLAGFPRRDPAAIPLVVASGRRAVLEAWPSAGRGPDAVD